MFNIIVNDQEFNSIESLYQYFLGLTCSEDKLAVIHAISAKMENFEGPNELSKRYRIECEILILYLMKLVIKDDKEEKAVVSPKFIDLYDETYRHMYGEEYDKILEEVNRKLKIK